MSEAALGGYSDLWTKMRWNQRQLYCKTEGSTAWDLLLDVATTSICNSPWAAQEEQDVHTEFEFLIAIDVLHKWKTPGKATVQPPHPSAISLLCSLDLLPHSPSCPRAPWLAPQGFRHQPQRRVLQTELWYLHGSRRRGISAHIEPPLS